MAPNWLTIGDGPSQYPPRCAPINMALKSLIWVGFRLSFVPERGGVGQPFEVQNENMFLIEPYITSATIKQHVGGANHQPSSGWTSSNQFGLVKLRKWKRWWERTQTYALSHLTFCHGFPHLWPICKHSASRLSSPAICLHWQHAPNVPILQPWRCKKGQADGLQTLGNYEMWRFPKNNSINNILYIGNYRKHQKDRTVKIYCWISGTLLFQVFGDCFFHSDTQWYLG